MRDEDKPKLSLTIDIKSASETIRPQVPRSPRHARQHSEQHSRRRQLPQQQPNLPAVSTGNDLQPPSSPAHMLNAARLPLPNSELASSSHQPFGANPVNNVAVHIAESVLQPPITASVVQNPSEARSLV